MNDIRMILLIVIHISLTIPLSAQNIWRVDNNAGNSADFRTVQEAADDTDNVRDGDKIYVAGSSQAYGSLNLDRQLHFFGPGYFLGENPETKAQIPSAKIVRGSEELKINAGASGSSITGFRIETRVVISGANNVLLRRCYILEDSILNRVLLEGSETSNITISQNYITGKFNGNGIFVRPEVGSGICIANNYVRSPGSSINATTGAMIVNNVLDGTLSVSDSTLMNNILVNAIFSGTNNKFLNNMGHQNQFGTDNGNLSNVDMSTVFVGNCTGGTASECDGKWQLKPGSPAIGAGENETDMGIFGGVEPYVLSGIPPIPSIYFFSAPSVGTSVNGLPVRLKIKSNK